MTSRFATNFNDGGLSPVRYLRVDREGVPLQGQVPLTFQTYSGTGNETIVYDGSYCLIIDSTLSAGALTVDFSAMNNYMGRYCDIVLTSVLASSFIMDFGAGYVVVPGVGEVHSTSTPVGFGPSSAMLVFYSLTRAALLKNLVTIPSTIIPGDEGDVLTTHNGFAEWLPPTTADSVKILTYNWSTDAANELNDNTGLAIIWDTNSANAVNQTDLVLSGTGGDPANTARFFTTATEANYEISWDAFVIGPLTTCLRQWIAVNSDIITYKECAFGLTGQSAGGKCTVHLVPGDIIAIYSGNASGPDSGTDSFVPRQDYYGTLSITQFI